MQLHTFLIYWVPQLRGLEPTKTMQLPVNLLECSQDIEGKKS